MVTYCTPSAGRTLKSAPRVPESASMMTGSFCAVATLFNAQGMIDRRKRFAVLITVSMVINNGYTKLEKTDPFSMEI